MSDTYSNLKGSNPVGVRIELGNEHPIEVVDDIDPATGQVRVLEDGSIAPKIVVDRSDLGSKIASGGFPDGWTLMEMLTEVDAMWKQQSNKPPSWVETDDPAITQAIAIHFNCPAGRPEGWEETGIEVDEEPVEVGESV